MAKSQYELEREANIARNKALLEELDMKSALGELIPEKPKATPANRSVAKPVQPAKKTHRTRVVAELPRRHSARLRHVSEPNETPAQKRKREAALEADRRKEERERLKREEQERVAKRPRHQDLELDALMTDDEGDGETRTGLLTSLQSLAIHDQPKRIGDFDAFIFDSDKKEEMEVTELRNKMKKLKVVARAKVTENRIYSAAYHPDKARDLIFFGDKHGQLGIWDARAGQDEGNDDDDTESSNTEQGKYWRLQVHWPATSKSSISSLKFNPIDSHSVYTTSYDCTVRAFDFTSWISREVYAMPDGILPSNLDLPATGLEMWISDSAGGLTHLDVRQHSSKARRYELSEVKIGCISVNPTRPHYLVTSSNSRALRIWDARKLSNIPVNLIDVAESEDNDVGAKSKSKGQGVGENPLLEEVNFNNIEKYLGTKKGEPARRAEWRHDKSVSSAYWDPRGRSIVSTSYDDTLRLWEFDSSQLDSNDKFPSSRPFSRISHSCQTGKWLTIFRAQWSPNPDVYPHFTIGNMAHSVDVYSCKGELITKLHDPTKITAVQAVTCSHPNVVERIATGNASGRCVLWAPADD